MREIIVIGCGGVGSNLLDWVVRYLQGKEEEYRLVMCDGDKIEAKNLSRQSFSINDFDENKAEAKRNKLEELLFRENVSLVALPLYIDTTNVNAYIRENSIVILAVDNYKTRKIIQEYTLKLKDIVLISIGNELIDGDMAVFIKKDGKEVAPPIWTDHKEIKNAKDKLPNELDCNQLAISQPQLINTNLMGALLALNTLHLILNGKNINYKEIYFDIEQQAVRAVKI